MNTFGKRLLLGLFLVTLLGPAFQARLRYFDIKPLQGAFTTAPHPSFTWAGLLDNTYQPALAQYAEDGIGFRATLIRLRNQLAFSLFRVTRSSDIMVGRHDVLFQPSTIATYRGQDFIGADQVRYRVRHLRAVQEALAQRGIGFLFVMAPNKARHEPEMLPAYLRDSPAGGTNYELFVREMKAQQVNLLDAAHLFQLWKDTTHYPLFPKGGTHWSGYGSMLVADTLFARMEQVGKFDLVDFRRQKPIEVRRDNLLYTDEDLSGSLNLLFPYQPDPAAYPSVAFDSLKAGQQQPNLLIIGDSFNWAFMQFAPYLRTLFAPESRFWGMDANIFVCSNQYTLDGHTLDQLDYRREIESRKFILVLMTEHNTYDNIQLNRLYDLYYPLSDAAKARVQQLEKTLHEAAENQQQLWDESTQGKHSFADELHGRALAQYEQEQIAAQK